jgi:hypothetical protein
MNLKSGNNLITKPGRYQHHKGGYYEVIGTGRHSETLEELVFYIKLDDKSLWARPEVMFTEEINKNGKMVPRFKFIKQHQFCL